jgi:hypothetical protein
MKNNTFLLAVSVCFLCGCGQSSNSGDPPSPSAITTTNTNNEVSRLLDQSIEAYGGKAAIEKLKAFKIKYHTHNFKDLSKSFPPECENVLIEDLFKYPDKICRTATTENGTKILRVSSNGRTMWGQDDTGRINTIAAPGFNEIVPPIVCRMYSLLNLKQNVHNIVLGETETIDGQTLDCIVLMDAGHPIGKVYFDPSTHYIKREVQYDTPDCRNLPTSVKQSAATETTPEDNKYFDGVVLATKTTVCQKKQKLFELQLLEIEFLKDIDDSLFEKPEGKLEK